MFGLFRPKPAPEGPVVFELEVLVEKPAADVYALIDWSDERNAKRALGSEVHAIEGLPGAFQMIWTPAPDMLFTMDVTHEEPHHRYAFDIAITPRPGKLVSSNEDYRFEAVDDASCRVKLVDTVEFEPGMTMREFKHEVAVMTQACHQALLKLKLHAEHGAEAAAELEGKVLTCEGWE